MATVRAPDAELIAAAAAGNLSAFSELVRLHRERVLRTAAGIVGSTDEAEDVAQLVFIRVWERLNDYDPSGSFVSWLYRITVNMSIDAVRRRRRQVPLDEDQPERAVEGPERQMLAADERRRVRAAIDRLPDKTRAALILREYEQLSYSEIAAALRIPIGTVMSRLNYARRAVASILQQEEAEGRDPSQ